jgi:glycosyltransferase involved in cell wall biosynthesis
MHSEQPLLTIGVPTWNRAKELQECIRSAAAQIVTVHDEVEIFVSDNASTDETEVLLEQLETEFKFLKHSRNDINLGPDGNFIETLKRSSGKYIWLFSDDDFLADGAVAEALRIIKTYEPSYIATNYLYCDDQRAFIKAQPQRRFMISEDISHTDLNRTFLERNHWLSFVSCNIYRRELLDFADYERNIQHTPNWIQVYIAADVLSKSPCGYLSSFSAVFARTGNARIDSSPFVLAMPKAFKYIFEKFHMDVRVERSIIKEIRLTFLPFRSFLAQRALGAPASPLLVPQYYKLGSLVPRKLISIAWKCKRFLTGKGFSLPDRRSIEDAAV